MNKKIDVFRFAIYRQLSANEKRRKEAGDILHLLLRLDEFIKFDDVQFGQDNQESPDFIFCHEGKQIGVELTDLDPKIFEKHGNIQNAAFKKWNQAIEPNGMPHKFDKWGKFSLRDSLAAFQERLNIKRKKANRWCHNFPERWLLMHIADGSPFSELTAGEQDSNKKIAPGMEIEAANYFAKATQSISAICQETQPFDYVLLYRNTDLATSICNLLAFSAKPANPHKLPVPPDEILKRGAAASDSYLDWKWYRKPIITVRRFDLSRGGVTEL